VELKGQDCSWFALPSQVRQGVQVLPSPQYPALQAHWEASAVEPARHESSCVALPLHPRHAWQVLPLP
jgi:hypothetical protein